VDFEGSSRGQIDRRRVSSDVRRQLVEADQAQREVGRQGTAYIYGALNEGDTPIPLLEMIPKMPAVKGYSIRLAVGDEARRKAAVEYVVAGLASGALKPVIDRTFKFDDMVEVHRYLESSEQLGKIVVTV
jgi:NADPH:quinone reductase-like Zn-dependent oxidoreductase